MHLVHGERGAVGPTGGFVEHNRRVFVVGEDPLDVERLRAASERKNGDQRVLDGFSTLVIAAVRPVPAEVKDTVVGEILERSVEIALAERCVRITDTADVRVFWHASSFLSRVTGSQRSLPPWR